MRWWIVLSLSWLAGPALAGDDEADTAIEPEAPAPDVPDFEVPAPEVPAPAAPEPAPAPASDSQADAEYVRLSFEMHDLAKKGAWDGVERAYNKALATGHALSFDEHMFGAQAALARGDVADGRRRLLEAKALKDSDKQVIETLWNLDTTYAAVHLTAEPGSTLQIAARPFDPQQATAVGYATHALHETGTFSGYLPAGHYTLEQTSFDVAVKELGAKPIEIDARTPKERRKDRP
jgi:hypothetical protein